MHVSFDSGIGPRWASGRPAGAKPPAKPDLFNKDNKTAVLLACAHGHEAAAALLVDPTKAADALDAVGDDVFSALMWVDSEERGLRSVSHKLRECGAADMRPREGRRGREGERNRGGTAASKNQGDRRRGGTERVGKWRRNKRE